MRSVAVAIAASYLSALGCSPSEATPGSRGGEAAVIRTPVLASLHGGPESIRVPETVRAGQPFEVAFETDGNSCVEKGQPRVNAWHLRAVITAYDLFVETPPTTVCQDLQQVFHHTAKVVLHSPGRSIVEIHGYDNWMRPVVYSREVVVQ